VERHSSRAPLAMVPLNVTERNTRYSGIVPSSTQYWSSARNTTDRRVCAIGSSTACDRLSHNCAAGISRPHVEGSRGYGAPQQSGIPSHYQHRTSIAGHSATHGRPMSSSSYSIQYPVAGTHIPRSYTSESRLSSVYPRPLPQDTTPVRLSGSRTLPYTAHRM